MLFPPGCFSTYIDSFRHMAAPPLTPCRIPFPHARRVATRCPARPGRMQGPGGRRPRPQEKRPHGASSVPKSRRPDPAAAASLYTGSTSLHLVVLLLTFLILTYGVGADPSPPAYVCLLSLPSSLPPFPFLPYGHLRLSLPPPQRRPSRTPASRRRFLEPGIRYQWTER